MEGEIGTKFELPLLLTIPLYLNNSSGKPYAVYSKDAYL